jgi:hypothetical protein
MNKELSNFEDILIGSWILKNGQVVSDDTSNRIDYLIQNVLKKLASSDDGWSILYLNPKDSRYWELVYHSSDLHGGGSPTLKCISKENAILKYHWKPLK